jgi:hypothetical protein
VSKKRGKFKLGAEWLMDPSLRIFTVPARYDNATTQATFEKSIDMQYLEHEVGIPL